GDIEQTPVSPAQLGATTDLPPTRTTPTKIPKNLFAIVLAAGGDPAEIIEARGMTQLTDTGALEKAVDEIIAADPDQVEKIK
ncbi:Asp-tRNA(Asn)/Glu-tRNA(Gln) amidotransferase GatCAB subunit B, partial [Rhizobium johnstonii]